MPIEVYVKKKSLIIAKWTFCFVVLKFMAEAGAAKSCKLRMETTGY